MRFPGRLPIESSQPVVVFCVVRLLLSLLALGVVILLGFPYQGELAAVVGGVAVPWSVFNLVLARRAPASALNPLIAAGDMLMLAAIEVVAPETYGAVRFMALCFLAVHAHFQGDRIGVPMAVLAVIVLTIPTAVLNEGAVRDELLVFYESVFAAAALATVALVGRFRTAESASRLRARELSRRTIRAEHEIRRKVSRSLHDGPVQELIGLDMTLAAARNEAAREGADSVAAMLDGARELTERNVQALRDEMLDLGPYAYEEFSLEAAIERCIPVWERRYGLSAKLELERLDLASETEGELFRIVQEAVVNAARHGGASTVTISLTERAESTQLTVRDDGSGFDGVDPLASTEPGHLGLASMRERTELLDGTLEIESSGEGTLVRVTVPQSRRARRSTVG